MAEAEILLGDTFDRPNGQYTNFAAIPDVQNTQLALQKHTDIRCMNQEDIRTEIIMLYLDLLTMSDLNTQSMGDLDGTVDGNVVVKRGEQWTRGIFGAQSDRNNWSGMSFDCSTGTNLTQSVMVT